MADNDGDSRMDSTPDASDNELATPTGEQVPANPADSLLSPADSQSRPKTSSAVQANTSMPVQGVGANANGKRPINTISNGAEDDETEVVGESSKMKGEANAKEHPPRTHEKSGYTWTKWEDAPGHSWSSRKAIDEFNRAMDGLVQKESVILNHYGDPFEMADKEKAIMNSLKQR
ncbi:hypothetical protein EJ03DRAFT_325440 [Teratosphaeria nubilosa]|uniref:Uncharacterized protein n=1 Tax=Teratosphaeria nubilosa TaxID=161662 RepID=A0A6G1LH96_9PEZI|nr:hypothetical protein EJ03DRAFT_325440 [Teratosphaeria nubilosa]